MWHIVKQTKSIIILIVVLLVFVNTWFIVQIRNGLKSYDYIGKPTDIRDTITIEGQGKVQAIPDVAAVDIGLNTEKADVKTAQRENTEKMNAITKQIKGLGVEDKDIQTTNYQIYPRYDYTQSGQKLRGYQVSQSARIKIRDLSKIGAILAAVGESGANQVSGVSFTIDDPEVLRQQAREKALENAKAKAEALANKAGVRLGKIVSFSEYGSAPAPMPYYAKGMALEMGGGGESAPDVQSGTLDIEVNVNVSYEIL